MSTGFDQPLLHRYGQTTATDALKICVYNEPVAIEGTDITGSHSHDLDKVCYVLRLSRNCRSLCLLCVRMYIYWNMSILYGGWERGRAVAAEYSFSPFFAQLKLNLFSTCRVVQLVLSFRFYCF